jgi:hypothetical protein
MSLWLTAEELVELTGYKTARRQKVALGQMRIPFFSSAEDGVPQVDRRRFQGDIVRPEKKWRGPPWPTRRASVRAAVPRENAQSRSAFQIP